MRADDRQPPKKEEKVAKVVQDIEPMMAMSSPVPPPREEVSSEAVNMLSPIDPPPGHCTAIGHGLWRGCWAISSWISAIGDDHTSTNTHLHICVYDVIVIL